jgi:hypothetical protein
MLKANFEEFDMKDIPSSVNELKANAPSGWTTRLEQILSRSMSFSEFEMLSHPVLLLNVVSTHEKDVLATMQDLLSLSNLPACLQNVSNS